MDVLLKGEEVSESALDPQKWLSFLAVQVFRAHGPSPQLFEARWPK